MSTPSVPAVIPMISVRDVQATIDWFTSLGFELLGAARMPDGSIGHAEVSRGELHIMFGPSMDGMLGSQGMILYVNLAEPVDTLCDSARAAGVTIAQEPTDQFWGDRTFAVTHPDGYRIDFANHVRDVSPEELEKGMAQMASAAV